MGWAKTSSSRPLPKSIKTIRPCGVRRRKFCALHHGAERLRRRDGEKCGAEVDSIAATAVATGS